MVDKVKVLSTGLIAIALSVPLIVAADWGRLGGVLIAKPERHMLIAKADKEASKTRVERKLTTSAARFAYSPPGQTARAIPILTARPALGGYRYHLTAQGLGGIRTTGEGGF